MRNSAVDNPRFLARTIGDWLEQLADHEHEPLTVVRRSADEARRSIAGSTRSRTIAPRATRSARGDHFGPDLRGVTARRDRDWLARFIVEPEKVRAAGDPIALALRAKYQQVRDAEPGSRRGRRGGAHRLHRHARAARRARRDAGDAELPAPAAGVNDPNADRRSVSADPDAR